MKYATCACRQTPDSARPCLQTDTDRLYKRCCMTSLITTHVDVEAMSPPGRLKLVWNNALRKVSPDDRRDTGNVVFQKFGTCVEIAARPSTGGPWSADVLMEMACVCGVRASTQPKSYVFLSWRSLRMSTAVRSMQLTGFFDSGPGFAAIGAHVAAILRTANLLGTLTADQFSFVRDEIVRDVCEFDKARPPLPSP